MCLISQFIFHKVEQDTSAEELKRRGSGIQRNLIIIFYLLVSQALFSRDNFNEELG